MRVTTDPLSICRFVLLAWKQGSASMGTAIKPVQNSCSLRWAVGGRKVSRSYSKERQESNSNSIATRSQVSTPLVS